jgi:hypothetical protein
MAGDKLITAGGVVMFFWDSGDDERHLTVNVEPDDHHKPEAFELTGDLRDQAIAEIDEGVRIEIDYRLRDHEMVDADGGISHRKVPEIVAVRISEA